MSNLINNVNYVSNNQNQGADSNNLPPKVMEAKRAYTDFVRKMNSSDFCNSSRRYIAELAFVRRLKAFYTEYNYSDLSKEMADKESEIIEKLKNDFGITFKD